jgi:hypothetical protein
MSSLELLDAFFPTSAALLPHTLRDALSAVAECPVPTATLTLALPLPLPLLPPRQLDVAWPSLLAVTLASVALALTLAARLDEHGKRGEKRRSRGGGGDDGAAAHHELALWRDACVLFAGMNLSAALAHCLLPLALSSQLAWPLRLARAADVAFTGASSTFLIAASAARRGRRGASSDDATTAKRRRRLATLAALALAFLALAGNAVPASVAAAKAAASPPPSLPRRAALAALSQGQLPLANEAAYLGPTLLAAALLSLSDVLPSLRGALCAPRQQQQQQQQHAWILAAAAASAALAFSTIALDAPLCRLLGPRGFGFGFNGVTLLFVACDLIFVALTRYALAAAAAEDGEEEEAVGGGKGAAAAAAAPNAIHLSAVAGGEPPATPAAAAKARHAAAAHQKKLF